MKERNKMYVHVKWNSSVSSLHSVHEGMAFPFWLLSCIRSCRRDGPVFEILGLCERSIHCGVRTVSTSPSPSSILKIWFTGVFLTVTLFLLLPSEGPVIAGAGKSRQPLWEIDLSKFGYQGRPPIPPGPEDTWGGWTYQQGVAFTEPNVVAVFFVVRDEPSGATSAHSKPSPSDPYRLVAVFLNADRGELIRKFDWPLPISTQSVSDAFFFPATKGRFIVGIGNTLLLYSPDCKLLARYDAQMELDPIVSPAGDTILVRDPQQTAGQWISWRFDLLDTDQLSVRKSWKEPSSLNQGPVLWGNELAWISPNSLYFKTLDTAPKQLIESKKEFCGYWSFINEETIAVLECGGAEKLLLVSTGGKIIHEFDFGLEQMDDPAIASQDGRRFAVPTYEWGSGRNADPKKLTARVFSLDTERPLLTLDVPLHYGAGPNSHTPNGDTRLAGVGLRYRLTVNYWQSSPALSSGCISCQSRSSRAHVALIAITKTRPQIPRLYRRKQDQHCPRRPCPHHRNW